MVKVGFICEGETEKIIVESPLFQTYLTDVGIECVKVVDVTGNGNLLPRNISNHLETMNRNGAEKIIILTDLDEEKCISSTKARISGNLPSYVCILIAVKTIESWFLADSETMSSLFQKNYYFPEPEQTKQSPFETIRAEFVSHHPGNRGPGRNKLILANRMIRAGFSIRRAALHENCKSAAYFISTLKQL